MVFFQELLSFKNGETNLGLHEPALVDSAQGFNIILYNKEFYGIPQSGGVFIKEKVQSGGYSSSFSGSSRRSVLRQISKAAVESKHLAKENARGSEPELILEGFHSYNIIRVGDEFHGILQSDGAFDRGKLLTGQYTCPLSGQSLNETKDLILEISNSSSSLSKGV